MAWRQALGIVGLVAVGSAVPSSQVRPDLPQNQPGFPTIGQVRVVNATADEAVPVVLTGRGDPQPVTVIGVPTVALLPTAVIAARGVRQAWEYRQEVVSSGQDVAAALNRVGSDGWEAVSGTTTSAGTVWTLKRPR